MFDIKTCPTCDGFLPPGGKPCPTCSQPGAEVSDPWSLGTTEATAETSGPAQPPPEGSLLAAGPSKARQASRSGMSTGAKVAIGVGIAIVVLGIAAVAVVFFGARWLAGEAGDAFTESFAEQLGAEDGFDQFQVEPTYALGGFSVGECYSLADGQPVAASCADPHYYEVFHLFEMPGDEPDAFAADSTCYEAFEGYVGVDYWESELFADAVMPDEGAWASGERTVACTLYEPFTELTGSQQGAAR